MLTRLLGPSHLALAEDVTQEAFIAALQHWPRTGIPESPAAWLLQVARRKALDALRRDRSFDDRVDVIAAELDERYAVAVAQRASVAGEDPFADDQLRMMLLCCHPAISDESRIALTLRTVGGFSVGEIARAFLAEETAVAQRLVRAKRALRDADVRFEMPPPAELSGRIDALLEVLYLMFNEGHVAHEGDQLLRRDLCHEALRLVETLAAHPSTTAPRVHALAALFCFSASRLDARTDASGAIVRLADQDRSSWDARLIARGVQHLERSAAGDTLSPYHLEAEIASCHAVATTTADTDWGRILAAYDRLYALTRSPVVALNRVVALRELRGAAAALEALDELPSAGLLAGYHSYHGVRAELLTALERRAEAARAWRQALEHARSRPVKEFIRERIETLGGISGDVDSSAPRPS